MPLKFNKARLKNYAAHFFNYGVNMLANESQMFGLLKGAKYEYTHVVGDVLVIGVGIRALAHEIHDRLSELLIKNGYINKPMLREPTAPVRNPLEYRVLCKIRV